MKTEFGFPIRPQNRDTDNFAGGRRYAPRAAVRYPFHQTLPLCILLSAGLVAGCSSDKEQIRFSDERLPEPTNSGAPAAVTAPPVPPPVAAPPQLQKPEKVNLLQVEIAVYGYLLQRHFWDTGEYSAIFLQIGDAEVEAVRRAFPHHNPPIKSVYHAELRPGRAPVDRDTGRPAMILSVDFSEPEGDKVEAIGRWNAGDAVTGFYTFTLGKVGGMWIIENVK